MSPLEVDASRDSATVEKVVSRNEFPNNERKVQFRRRIKVFEIPHLSDFSKEELKSTWYSREESHVIRNTVRDTSDLICSDSVETPVNTNGICMDGLLSPTERNRRRRMIHAAVDAVLMEQDFQEYENLHEEDVLADIYFLFTRESQWEALERARCHAENVTHSD